MGQELVKHGSDIVVSPMQKEPVRVRHRVLLIPSVKIYILKEGEDSLWDKIQNTTRRIGVI